MQAYELTKGDASHAKIVINADARPEQPNDPNGAATSHSRRYNAPQKYVGKLFGEQKYGEVSVLMADAETHGRDLVVHLRGGGLQYIHETHRSFDALHFVLLFPRGEDGWTIGLRKADSRQQVSPCNFYAHKLQWRIGEDGNNALLMSQRLFQEYCCSAFAKAETQRLSWQRKNQKTLRAALYQNLVDHVESGDAGKQVGKRVVLSSSFVGGPRDMSARYQDAMAIVRERGKPSFFITFTCNPNWTEITESLPAGVKATDRPDIVSRVFNQKLQALLTELKEDMIFGEAVAHLSVVEFQKRGLPHAHILLIVKRGDRINSADEIDNAVVAELPPHPGPRPPPGSDEDIITKWEKADALLRLACEHMVHNDCGRDRACPCLDEDGCCTKKFPKEFAEETAWSDFEIYPQYKRRAPRPGDPVIEHRGRRLDNRWVVPYNPYLLAKYQAHINVEVCISVESVKYLYKYVRMLPDLFSMLRMLTFVAVLQVYKGPKAMVRMDTDGVPIVHDEIKNYQDMRCIGACEACWRLYEFDLYSRSPPVKSLPVHLSREMEVLFEEGMDFDDAKCHQERASQLPPTTELSEWLRYVSHGGTPDDRGADAPWRRLTYAMFPRYYTFKNKRWKLKERNLPGSNIQGVAVGRLNYVHPSAGERFFVRLLLTKVTGQQLADAAMAQPMAMEGQVTADVFELLKFGQETYKQACQELGMLADDTEWDNVLQDAALSMMPSQMRSIFVSLQQQHHGTNHTVRETLSCDGR